MKKPDSISALRIILIIVIYLSIFLASEPLFTQNTLPVLYLDGSWSITNNPTGDFAVWAASPNVRVVTGRFDADDRTDICLLGTIQQNGVTQPKMAVAYSRAYGAFEVKEIPLTDFAKWASSGSVRILTGDFDNNGLTDIILVGKMDGSSVNNNILAIALTQKKGLFEVQECPNKELVALMTSSYVHILTGDFNNDHATEVCLVGIMKLGNTTEQIMAIMYIQPDGTFNWKNNPAGDFAIWATGSKINVLAGDFNKDGLTDIGLVGIVQQSGKKIYIMAVAYTKEDGTFRVVNNPSDKFVQWAGEPGVRFLSGDFNGDGSTDIGLVKQDSGWKSIPIAYTQSNGTFVIKNNHVGQFADWASSPGAKIITGDFNNDKFTDIALVRQEKGWNTIPAAFTCTETKTGINIIVKNNPAEEFTTWAMESGMKIISGDFNGDGGIDIGLAGIFMKGDQPARIMAVASHKKDGNNFGQSSIGNFAGWSMVRGVKIISGDFNGDGRTDVGLVNQNPGWNTIPVAYAQVDGTFSIKNNKVEPFTTWATNRGVQVISGDFDGDGPYRHRTRKPGTG